MTLSLESDDVVSYETPGGGGYGDPLKRDPEAVLSDVIDEKVSVERAREVYGVVVDVSTRSVDVQATNAQRAKISKQRK